VAKSGDSDLSVKSHVKPMVVSALMPQFPLKSHIAGQLNLAIMKLE
jgi:hypothetical protein